MNRDQPVKIEANTLEVRDKIRQATFSGDVKLIQGDTTLKCKVLVVFYEDTAMGGSGSKKGAPAQGAPQAQKGGGGLGGGGGQQIKRAEAKGDVFVIQKDQTASGDNAVYDLKSDTIVMTGNVVLTQGPQVLRGAKMVVELKSGLYRFEGGTRGADGGGRVDMMLNPSAAKEKDAKAGPTAPTPPAPAAKDAKPAPISPPAAKATPGKPTRIN